MTQVEYKVLTQELLNRVLELIDNIEVKLDESLDPKNE